MVFLLDQTDTDYWFFVLFHSIFVFWQPSLYRLNPNLCRYGIALSHCPTWLFYFERYFNFYLFEYIQWNTQILVGNLMNFDMHVNSCNHHPDRDTEHSHLFVPPSHIFGIGNTLCFILKCIFGSLAVLHMLFMIVCINPCKLKTALSSYIFNCKINSLHLEGGITLTCHSNLDILKLMILWSIRYLWTL